MNEQEKKHQINKNFIEGFSLIYIVFFFLIIIIQTVTIIFSVVLASFELPSNLGLFRFSQNNQLMLIHYIFVVFVVVLFFLYFFLTSVYSDVFCTSKIEFKISSIFAWLSL